MCAEAAVRVACTNVEREGMHHGGASPLSGSIWYVCCGLLACLENDTEVDGLYRPVLNYHASCIETLSEFVGTGVLHYCPRAEA